MLIALLLAFPVHPDSVSSTRIVVREERVQLLLRSEERTFLEVLALDQGGDGLLDAAELRAGSRALADYVASRYRLLPLGGVPLSGAPLALGFVGVRAIASGSGILAGKRVLELEFASVLPGACDGLEVTSTLFVESNPLHRDQCEIVWNELAPATKLLWSEDRTWVFRRHSRERPNVVGEFLALGVRHILEGFDHLAFLLALVVASRGLGALVGVVTAFTLAHSCTLAAAALGWIVPPARIVELLIALSIVFVALRNLLDDRPRSLWPEALGFGLVHGLGFAGALSLTLSAEPQRLRALLGFNLGVEIGQLAVVLVALALLAGARAVRPSDAAGRLAPRWVRIPASWTVALFGGYWVVSRAF